MSYTEVSAREPIFYRWHGHLEDLMQEYRDTKLPKYPKHEFNLQDDVKVVGIKTVMDKTILHTNENLENVLITYTEKKELKHSASSTISYNRINHKPFQYRITLSNPKKSLRKVIVRIWLGLYDENSPIK